MISQEQKDKAAMEKRKHVRIVSMCNNNCIFCLAGDKRKKKFMRSIEDLKKELVEGLNHGCTRLILSGGEPTINKNIASIAKFAKELGYEKIQVISNGRMFAYNKFAKDLTEAGVDEVTFSIHSHLPEVHDYLTGVKGSFEQSIKGLKNVLSLNKIVSVDIVLNKLNIEKIKETLEFFNNIGAKEFDLLMVTPFGYAFDNKEELFFDLEKEMPHLRKAFDYAKEACLVLWTNRLPAKYLEGYEHLIQDSFKINDEVEGRKKLFSDFVEHSIKPSCMDERCGLCYMNSYCSTLAKTKEKNSFEENEKETDFSLAAPEGSVSDYKKISPSPEKIKEIISKKPEIKIMNLPKCLVGEKNTIVKNNWASNSELFAGGKLNLEKFTKEFIRNYKVKALKCRECKFNNECEGIFQHYIKIYGFKILKPIK